jgi:HD-GYP domain-containing protein (c-di-GMP phosphodiesterase class II)
VTWQSTDAIGMAFWLHRTSLSRDSLLLIAALTPPVLGFAVLRLVPALDLRYDSVLFHLIIISGLSGCALVIAVLAAVAAGRTGHRSLTLLGAACLTVGVFMLGHGLATPGIADRPMNMWVSRFPVIALAGFAAFLAAALRRPSERPGLIDRHPRIALGSYALVISVGVTAAVLWPAAGPGHVMLHGENDLGDVVLLLCGLTLLATGWRYRRRFRLGRDRVQLALALASWLGVEAIVSLRFGAVWQMSWWVYHALLLAGFGSAVYAVLTEYRRVRLVDEALSGVRMHDDMEHITRGYPEALRALVAAVEAKDEHTHGHSARVAEYSVRLGQQMGLGPTQLRELAQGAVLHDIGKIGTADAVLNKPGPLTAEERVWIEQHPIAGWEIVRQAPSLHAALSVVRHHHERWDGAGYPDGLVGEDIPLQARMAAVADVWDALTSERAYRPAWSTQRALDHIVAGAGSQFDPACVEAFVHVLALQGIAPTGEPATAEAAAAAANDCHVPLNASALKR